MRLQFLGRVSPELRTFFELKSRAREDWVPLDLFHEALVVADAVGGRGDLETCVDIGRYIAQHEGGAVRSLALRLLRPAVVMSLTSSLWQVKYRNAGRAVTHVAGASAINLSVLEYPMPHRAHCLSVVGWVRGALALGRRKGIRVDKVACRCDGAASCDYRIAWEE